MSRLFTMPSSVYLRRVSAAHICCNSSADGIEFIAATGNSLSTRSEEAGACNEPGEEFVEGDGAVAVGVQHLERLSLVFFVLHFMSLLIAWNDLSGQHRRTLSERKQPASKSRQPV